MEGKFALFKEKSVTKYSEEQLPVQQRDLELREAFIQGSGHTPPPQITVKTWLGNRKLFIK